VRAKKEPGALETLPGCLVYAAQLSRKGWLNVLEAWVVVAERLGAAPEG